MSQQLRHQLIAIIRSPEPIFYKADACVFALGIPLAYSWCDSRVELCYVIMEPPRHLVEGLGVLEGDGIPHEEDR